MIKMLVKKVEVGLKRLVELDIGRSQSPGWHISLLFLLSLVGNFASFVPDLFSFFSNI